MRAASTAAIAQQIARSRISSANSSRRSAGSNFEPGSPRIRCAGSGIPAAANISVRVNPDIDAKTHHKIATGKAENKFGIPIGHAREVYARAAKLPAIKAPGVHMHIGSQIPDLDPFDNAFAL